MLLQCITFINFDEDEDDETWGVSQSTACCLSIVAKLAKDAIVDLVLAFVERNI
jgi:hypothetical protein